MTRDDLIDKVQHGAMTPDEAEAEAERLGLPRLASHGDGTLDPLREPDWTLPMAAAWIAYRTSDAVREQWDDYRFECWEWRFRKWRVGFDGPIHEGHFLEQRSRATLALLSISDSADQRADRDPVFSMMVKEAISALWIALQSGCLDASGIDLDGGRRVLIDVIQWRDLDWFEERGQDVIRSELKQDQNTVRFGDVTVRSNAVIGLWPIPRPVVRCALPPIMRPEAGGFMPLFCAAQWIATEGGKIDFDPEEVRLWAAAYAALLDRMSSGEVLVSGVANGLREPIAGTVFAGCQVDYPFQSTSLELMFSEAFYLRSSPYLGEDEWRKGYDDAFENRWGTKWSRLMARKEDIARLWPFADSTGSRSGAPGRPTSRHLVEAEFERRCQTGEVLDKIGNESRTLSAWLQNTYPLEPRLTPRAVENVIRPSYRRHRTARN